MHRIAPFQQSKSRSPQGTRFGSSAPKGPTRKAGFHTTALWEMVQEHPPKRNTYCLKPNPGFRCATAVNGGAAGSMTLLDTRSVEGKYGQVGISRTIVTSMMGV